MLSWLLEEASVLWEPLSGSPEPGSWMLFLACAFGEHRGPGVIGLKILASVELVDIRVHMEFLWSFCSRYHWYCFHSAVKKKFSSPDFVCPSRKLLLRVDIILGTAHERILTH